MAPFLGWLDHWFGHEINSCQGTFYDFSRKMAHFEGYFGALIVKKSHIWGYIWPFLFVFWFIFSSFLFIFEDIFFSFLMFWKNNLLSNVSEHYFFSTLIHYSTPSLIFILGVLWGNFWVFEWLNKLLFANIICLTSFSTLIH